MKTAPTSSACVMSEFSDGISVESGGGVTEMRSRGSGGEPGVSTNF
jgi:hypothetical protein